MFANRPTGRVELITPDGCTIDITPDQWTALHKTVHLLITAAFVGTPTFFTLKFVTDYIMILLT